MAEYKPKPEEARPEEAAPSLREVKPEEAAVVEQDRIRWAAIWGGVIVALATQLFLSALGIAFGFANIDITNLATLRSIGAAVGIWLAVTAIISLFLGSLIAARISAITGRINGAIAGLIVWGLSIVVASVLAAFGVTGFFSFLGSTASVLRNLIGSGLITGIQVGQAELSAATDLAVSSAGWFVFGSIVGLGAALLGGIIGMTSRES
jgi:hypothetical protein